MSAVLGRPWAAASSPSTPDFEGSREVDRVAKRDEVPQDCNGPAKTRLRLDLSVMVRDISVESLDDEITHVASRVAESRRSRQRIEGCGVIA